MKLNKIMIVSLVLLAIMTLGAVSATEELTANETQDSLELSVDDSADIISEDDSGANEIVGQDDERLDPQITVDNLSDEDCWVDNQVWIGVHIPARATGEITLYADGDYYDSENLWYDEDMGEWCEFLGFNYRFKHVGTTKFLIDYEGCDKYLPAQVTFEYNMENTRYNIFFSNEEAYVGQERVYLDTPRGFSGDIFITVNGETYDVEREDDVEGYSYYIDSSILNYGENNVTLSTQGDDLYGEHEANRTVYLKFKAIFTETYVFGSDEPLITINLPEDANGTLSIYKEIMIWNEETFDDEYKLIFLTSDDVESGFAAISDLNLTFGGNYFVAIYEGNYGTSESRGEIYYVPKYVIPRVVVAGEEAYVTVECPEDLEGNLTVFLFPDDWDYYEDDFKVNSSIIENGKAVVGFKIDGLGEKLIKVKIEGYYADVSRPIYALEDMNLDFDVYFYFDDEILIDSELEFRVDLPEYATGVINVYLDDDLIESRNLDDEDYDDYFSFDAVGLECGSHNLTVKVESYDFENAEITKEFNVTSAVINIPEEVIYNSRSSDNYVRVYLNDDAAGTVTVLLNGTLYKEGDVEDGYWRASIWNVPCDTYNITVIYSGDDKYSRQSVSRSLNISYQINFWDTDFLFENDEYLVGFGAPYTLDINKVTVTVDGKQYSIESSMDPEEGNIVNVTGIGYGAHELVLKYLGDDIYPAREFRQPIGVYSRIYIPSSWSEDDNVHLILPGDAEGKLLVNISKGSYDDEEYEIIYGTPFITEEIPLEDGKAFYSLSDLEIGEYLIRCEYVGGNYEIFDEDNFSTNTFSMGANIHFTGVMEMYTAISCLDNDTICIETPGWEGEFEVLVDLITDSYWDDDNWENVYVTENIINETIPLKDGKANFTISPLKLGNYFITGKYLRDGNFVASSKNEIEVRPIEINTPYYADEFSVVMPEDTVGNATLKIYEFDYGSGESEFISEITEQFIDGVATFDVSELPDGEYRLVFNCTTENYGAGEYSEYCDKFIEDEPVDEIEFNTIVDDESVGIGENVVIARLLIPNNDEFEDTVVTIVITKNGEAFKTIKTSDLSCDIDSSIEAKVYEIAIDTTKLSDKDLLNITLDCFDDEFWTYAIQTKEDYLIFNEYSDISSEFYAFYGNLTTGDLNDPELMGPHPDGNFIVISIADSCGITDGTITVSAGDNTILSKALSECNNEYSYGILGKDYFILLNETDLSMIPENTELTIAFRSGNIAFEEKRIRVSDYVYILNTAERIGRYMNVDIADGILSGEEEYAVRFKGTEELNPQSVWIDAGSGYFNIYVNGTKVENLGALLVFEDEEEIPVELEFERLSFRQFRTFLLNLTALGITENGIYDIRVTHSTFDLNVNIDGEHQFYPCETEIINKNITVRLAGTVELADPALKITVEDIDYGEEALISISTNKSFTGKVLVQIGDKEYPVNVTNGAGEITVPGLSANDYIAIATFKADEAFKYSRSNDTFTVNKIDMLLVVEGATLEWNTSANITVKADGAVTALLDGNAVSVVDGVIFLSPALSVGDHPLSVTVAGDANHNTVVKNVTVAVVPAKSSVSLSNDIKFDYGTSGSTAVSFSDAKGVTAIVVDHPEAKVDINGSLITVSGLNAGSFLLKVTTTGFDENHTAATASVPVTVNKLSTAVSAASVKTTYGTSKWLVITLTSNGTNLADKDVTVVIDKKVYTAQKLANGQYKIATPKALAVGKYPVAVSFAGETNYAASKAPSTAIAVYKATPKLTAKGAKFKVSNKAKKYVVVLRTDKNALYKGKVAIRVGGKTYTANAVKGKATFSLNKLSKAGNYLALVKFVGDKNYKAVTVKNVKIIVK